MNKTLQTYLYTFVCILLLLAESLFISLQVDAQGIVVANSSLSWLLAHMGDLLRWVIISSAIFVALIFCFKKGQLSQLIPKQAATITSWFLHFASYGCLLYLSIILFSPEARNIAIWLPITWFIAAIASLVTWLKLLYPIDHITDFLKQNLKFILFAGIIGASLIIITINAGNLWKPLSLITLHTSSALLSLFFSGDVFVDAPNKLLGVREFVVLIAPECSGIEGLITSLGITGIYLIALRRQLKFPIAFLLLPIAIILSIVLNTVRIAVLLAIGALISPDIAVEGFHSVAGWISAAIVAFLVIFVFSSLSIFNKPINTTEKQTTDTKSPLVDDSDLSWAILVPFIITLIVSLFSKILIEDFNYLYPLKVIFGGIALLYFWKYYQLKLPQQWLEPIIAGAIIAVLWVLLVPTNPEYDLIFIFSLTDMSQTMIYVWLGFRLIGFWLMAPLLEELVFRGYILARLSKQSVSNENNLSVSIIAIVISSVIFGIMHSAFVAGFIAGVIFAIVRYRTKSLSEPILSHVVANVLVALWAIDTEQWSLL
ncbi:MAG: exosortase E/protease, VPEID-CTERM system [Cellvibrionaceae bacterium]